MAKFELGAGLKFLVITVSVCILIWIGFYGGTKVSALNVEESNVNVLSDDSIVGLDINEDTEELKYDAKEFIKNNAIFDSDGNPTDEWLRYLEHQRSIARERGDQASIVRKITKMRP